MRFFTTLFVSVLTALSPLTHYSQSPVNYPETEQGNVSDIYFGQNIKDPFRWLEDDRSPKTEAWVKEQNKVTEAYMSEIDMRSKVHNRLTELWNYNKQSAPFKKGDYYFCYRNTGLQNQSVLYMSTLLDASPESWTMVLDPNTLSADGTVALNNISISKNSKTMAYSVSKAGSDWQEIRFKNLETKKDLPDVIKWVKFSGVSWKGDGVYYSRYDEPKGSALSQKNTEHKVYYHKLGTQQTNDELIYKDDTHPDYNFSAQTTNDERYLIIYASSSTSGSLPMIKDLKQKSSKFILLAENFNFDFSVIDNVDSTFYLLTNKEAAKYKLVSFTFSNFKIQNEKIILPESTELLEGVRLCNNKIIADYLYHAASKMFAYDLNGKLIQEIKLPGICKVRGVNTNKD